MTAIKVRSRSCLLQTWEIRDTQSRSTHTIDQNTSLIMRRGMGALRYCVGSRREKGVKGKTFVQVEISFYPSQRRRLTFRPPNLSSDALRSFVALMGPRYLGVVVKHLFTLPISFLKNTMSMQQCQTLYSRRINIQDLEYSFEPANVFLVLHRHWVTTAPSQGKFWQFRFDIARR